LLPVELCVVLHLKVGDFVGSFSMLMLLVCHGADTMPVKRNTTGFVFPAVFLRTLDWHRQGHVARKTPVVVGASTKP